MTNKIVIGGWNVEIVAEHKLVQTDPDGFKFSKIFCEGQAAWNRRPVYFMLAGGTRAVRDRFDSIEDMRKAYGDHLADGWTAK